MNKPAKNRRLERLLAERLRRLQAGGWASLKEPTKEKPWLSRHEKDPLNRMSSNQAASPVVSSNCGNLVLIDGSKSSFDEADTLVWLCW
jgi:hypothetical protein